jgi:peptide/nickel transport system permease protein
VSDALPLSAAPDRMRPPVRPSVVKRVWRVCRRDGAAALGLALVGVVILMAALGPALAPHSPIAVVPANRLQPPGATFPLGTDELGRDVFSRILHGARTSVLLALAIIASATAVGSLLGGVAGYFGGRVESVIMRVVDLMMAFPYLILAMAIAFALGPGAVSTAVALAAVWWPSYARLVRGMVLSLRQNLYVEAARALGARNGRVVTLHILPHCLPVLGVRITSDLGSAIIAAASLSFIGLGPQPPSPDWGAMISGARFYVSTAWWYGLFPGVALFITVMAFALVGDALQDALDPRLRGRG